MKSLMYRARRALMISALMAGPLVGPAGGAQAETPSPGPSNPKMLTIERIYADPPLTGTAPTGIRWLPDSKGVSFMIEESSVDDTVNVFIIASVPSGKRRTVCRIDDIPVPDDLQKKDDVFSIGGYEWNADASKIAFTFQGDIFTLDSESGEVGTRCPRRQERRRDDVRSGHYVPWSRDDARRKCVAHGLVGPHNHRHLKEAESEKWETCQTFRFSQLGREALAVLRLPAGHSHHCTH